MRPARPLLRAYPYGDSHHLKSITEVKERQLIEVYKLHVALEAVNRDNVERSDVRGWFDNTMSTRVSDRSSSQLDFSFYFGPPLPGVTSWS